MQIKQFDAFCNWCCNSSNIIGPVVIYRRKTFVCIFIPEWEDMPKYYLNEDKFDADLQIVHGL